MSDIIQTRLPPEIVEPSDLSAASSDDLRARLADALTATADGLYRAAAIWIELRRRGEAPDLRSGLAEWLPRIARRELAAETVIAFAGQRMLLGRITGMPLDEQRRLAAGETVTVAEVNEAGEIVGRQKPLRQLSSREVLLAIDSGEVRPLTAQVRSLSHSITSARRPRAQSGQSTAVIRADRQAGLLVVGRSRLAPTDLVSALHALGYRLTRDGGDDR